MVKVCVLYKDKSFYVTFSISITNNDYSAYYSVSRKTYYQREVIEWLEKYDIQSFDFCYFDNKKNKKILCVDKNNYENFINKEPIRITKHIDLTI